MGICGQKEEQQEGESCCRLYYEICCCFCIYCCCPEFSYYSTIVAKIKFESDDELVLIVPHLLGQGPNQPILPDDDNIEHSVKEIYINASNKTLREKERIVNGTHHSNLRRRIISSEKSVKITIGFEDELLRFQSSTYTNHIIPSMI